MLLGAKRSKLALDRRLELSVGVQMVKGRVDGSPLIEQLAHAQDQLQVEMAPASLQWETGCPACV